MSSSSTADVLDEATVTLITQVKQMKQQVEHYITKLQSLGRCLQLQDFRTWLNKKCNLPINIRPQNVNTKEYMEQDQIQEWITEWTNKHSKGREQNVLRNFLLQEFSVVPEEKCHKCDGCNHQFMHFMLLPMRSHNMDMYDPDEYHLFCCNCCTEVSQLLSQDHPEHQASERKKAMTQRPPGLSLEECETGHLLHHPTRTCDHPPQMG